MAKEKLASASRSKPLPLAAGAAIDLGRLCEMHPRLPADMAGVMVVRAALGLQRNKHSSGAHLQMAIENLAQRCILRWPLADLGVVRQHDDNRITEDGAEAIALAVANTTKTWRVVRRMQREEHADWLLEHQDNGRRKLVAFEVSGVDQGNIAGRLQEKLSQVANNVDTDQQCAGVVGFMQPEAALQSVGKHKHGH